MTSSKHWEKGHKGFTARGRRPDAHWPARSPDPDRARERIGRGQCALLGARHPGAGTISSQCWDHLGQIVPSSRLPGNHAVHPAGRIRNFGIRNRAPEIYISSNFLRSKIKKIVYEPIRIVLGKVGGRSPPTLRGRRTPNMVQNGPKLTPQTPDSQPKTCIS